MDNLEPNNNDSGDSFEKTEDLINRSFNQDQDENTSQIEKKSENKSTENNNNKIMKEMIEGGKFTTFQSPENIPDYNPVEDSNSKEFQPDSLKNCIDKLGNLEPTESEKKVKISEKYDINMVVKESIGNSRYANFDSNIPDGEDDEENKDRVTDLHEITRYGNKSLFGVDRFTDSVNMRIEDYKRTSNYQQLIGEELLKDQMEVPDLPETVINPVKTNNDIEVMNKDKIGDIDQEKQEQEQEEQEQEGGKRNRHLTMIRKARDTEMTFDNNLTIMELANDIGSEQVKENFDSEDQVQNNLFKNQNIMDQIIYEKSNENIIKKEDNEDESKYEEINVTNLESNEPEPENENQVEIKNEDMNWFKKNNTESNIDEEVEEIPLPDADKNQKLSSEAVTNSEVMDNNKEEIPIVEKSKNN